MAITVKVLGVETVKSDLLQLPPALEKSVIRQMAQIAFDAAYRDANSHSKSGKLTQSLFNRAIPNGREVGHDPTVAPHALFVHFGTRPHKIRPKDKKALRWAGPNGFIFAREVNHPGYRGDPYLNRAADDAIRRFSSIVDNAIKEAQ